MPQLDVNDFAPQLIWLAITFVTLYWVMAKIALPRIGMVIEERRDRIASDLDQAEQLKQKTEQAIAAYEQALAESRAKAHAIARETREKIARELEDERAQFDRKMAEQAEAAEARIAAAKEDALSQVNAVAAATAESIVTALVGGSTTKRELDAAVAKAQAE